MSEQSDVFRQELMKRHVEYLRSELFESRREKFDEWAKDKTLEEQVEVLVREAMKSYVEPEFLKPAVQQELPLPPRPVRQTYKDD